MILKGGKKLANILAELIKLMRISRELLREKRYSSKNKTDRIFMLMSDELKNLSKKDVWRIRQRRM